MLLSKSVFSKTADPVAERVSVSLKSLIDLAKPAANLKLHHLGIRALQSGGYVSRFKGRGMEFDEARLYQPGDDIRSIDWRVTARTGKAHTKVFREERERPVFISVDNRPAMQFATRGVFKSVLAAKLAGLLAWTAQHHGDRIGGQLFSEQDCRELKPQNGKHAVLRFLNALAKQDDSSLLQQREKPSPAGQIHRERIWSRGERPQGSGQDSPETLGWVRGKNTAPSPVTTQAAEFTLEHVLARLVRHAHPGSLVYIISDFRGINDQAETHLTKLSQHCDVILVFVYDPLESHLPSKGRYRFTDDERDVVIDTGDQQRLINYRQHFVQRQQRLDQLAKKRGLALIQCSTVDDPIQCLR